MINFIKINNQVKIIPSNPEDILNGLIVDCNENKFTIKLQSNTKKTFDYNSTSDILIKHNTCIIKFEANFTVISDELIEIETPKNYKIIQRREYPRVNVNSEIKVTNSSCPDKFIAAKIINLSGGGISFETNAAIKAGDLLNTTLDFIKTKSINVLLDVVRSTSNELINIVSASFKKILNSDRILIIQYCLKKQLESKYKNTVIAKGGLEY